MHVSFIKVIHFTRLIKAGGRLREFNFRKLRDAEPETFTVDTVDDRGNRILFRMQKNGNSLWALQSQMLPKWIPESETRLHDAITDELNNPTEPS
ncbi:MAG: hypothetical protein JNK14_18970 [Chitinophagaceae bacterium]|nr:hypothetical protein [Chitinophagaceae bacterium]